MKNTFLAFSGILLLSLTVSGCFKRDFFETEDEQENRPVTCMMTKYSCTIDNDPNSTINGIVRYDSLNGFRTGLSDISDWGTIRYVEGESVVYFDYNGVDCRLYFSGGYIPSGALYQIGSNLEESLNGEMRGYGELDWMSILLRNFSTFKFYYHIIDSIVYQNGDIVSYTYTESLYDYPYTVTKHEKYTITYLQTEYDKSLFPNKMFFFYNYRPILGREYSLGERFDPQYYSKHLVESKRLAGTNQVIFRNSYSYGDKGRVVTLYQDFLSGGYQPTTLKWTYEYSCN